MSIAPRHNAIDHAVMLRMTVDILVQIIAGESTNEKNLDFTRGIRHELRRWREDDFTVRGGRCHWPGADPDEKLEIDAMEDDEERSLGVIKAALEATKADLDPKANLSDYVERIDAALADFSDGKNGGEGLLPFLRSLTTNLKRLGDERRSG